MSNNTNASIPSGLQYLIDNYATHDGYHVTTSECGMEWIDIEVCASDAHHFSGIVGNMTGVHDVEVGSIDPDRPLSQWQSVTIFLSNE